MLDHEEFRVFRTARADYIIVYELERKTLRKPNYGETTCVGRGFNFGMAARVGGVEENRRTMIRERSVWSTRELVEERS